MFHVKTCSTPTFELEIDLSKLFEKGEMLCAPTTWSDDVNFYTVYMAIHCFPHFPKKTKVQGSLSKEIKAPKMAWNKHSKLQGCCDVQEKSSHTGRQPVGFWGCCDCQSESFGFNQVWDCQLYLQAGDGVKMFWICNNPSNNLLHAWNWPAILFKHSLLDVSTIFSWSTKLQNKKLTLEPDSKSPQNLSNFALIQQISCII